MSFDKTKELISTEWLAKASGAEAKCDMGTIESTCEKGACSNGAAKCDMGT